MVNTAQITLLLMGVKKYAPDPSKRGGRMFTKSCYASLTRTRWDVEVRLHVKIGLYIALKVGCVQFNVHELKYNVARAMMLMVAKSRIFVFLLERIEMECNATENAHLHVKDHSKVYIVMEVPCQMGVKAQTFV